MVIFSAGNTAPRRDREHIPGLDAGVGRGGFAAHRAHGADTGPREGGGSEVVCGAGELYLGAAGILV